MLIPAHAVEAHIVRGLNIPAVRMIDRDDEAQDRALAGLYRRQAAMDAAGDMASELDGADNALLDELALDELLIDEFDPDRLMADLDFADENPGSRFLGELLTLLGCGGVAVDDSDGGAAHPCGCGVCSTCLTSEAQAEYARYA